MRQCLRSKLNRAAVLPFVLVSSLLVQPQAGAAKPAVPAAMMPVASTAGLEADLADISVAAKGTVGVAAWRLDGRGPKVFLNANESFPMASTYKVAVAGAILAAVDAGRLRLDQMVPVEPRHLLPSDVIAERFIHPGVTLSVHNLLELMLTESDNTATDVLMEVAGGPPAVTQWVRSQGVNDLRVDRNTDSVIRQFFGFPAAGESLAQLLAAHPELEASGVRPNAAFDNDPQDTTTPTAMATLLTRIFSGTALSPANTRVISEIMGRCRTGVNRLKGRLPEPVVVAHKTGTIGGTVNDVGVITLPANGGAVVIAVYIKKSEAMMEQRERVIADIARSVRDFYLHAPLPW
jgi:beta-lactamase class A